MPIYEYVCSACGHRTDILHGVHEAGPHFCPACGAEATMRKAIAAPAIHFKGSGWAKKERRSSSGAASSATKTGEGDSSGGDGSGGDGSGGGSATNGSAGGEATSKPAAAKDTASSGAGSTD